MTDTPRTNPQQVFLWQHEEGRVQWRYDCPGPRWNRVGTPELCYRRDAERELAKRDAEVERLRKQLLLAGDEIERLNVKTDERDAEIERLRTMLREVRETGGIANDLVRDRIDAALKEKP